MTDCFVYAAARTPVGRYGGALAQVRADDLAALVVGEAVRRATGIDPAWSTTSCSVRQPGRRRQPQRRADGGAARRTARHRARPHREPALRERPAGDQRGRFLGTRRRGRSRGRRRGRVDDPGPLGDRPAREGLQPADRDGRHRPGLAAGQPADAGGVDGLARGGQRDAGRAPPGLPRTAGRVRRAQPPHGGGRLGRRLLRRPGRAGARGRPPPRRGHPSRQLRRGAGRLWPRCSATAAPSPPGTPLP